MSQLRQVTSIPYYEPRLKKCIYLGLYLRKTLEINSFVRKLQVSLSSLHFYGVMFCIKNLGL